MLLTPKAEMENLSPQKMLKHQAGFIAIVCRLSNVPLDRYEQWRDSMSDHYFWLLVERLFEKDMLEVLLRRVTE